MAYFLSLVFIVVLTCTWLVLVRSFEELGMMGEAFGAFIAPIVVIGGGYLLIMRFWAPSRNAKITKYR